MDLIILMNIVFNTVSKLFTPRVETEVATHLIPVLVKETRLDHLRPSQADTAKFTHFMATYSNEALNAANEALGKNNKNTEVIGIQFNPHAKSPAEVWRTNKPNSHGTQTNKPVEKDGSFLGKIFGK